MADVTPQALGPDNEIVPTKTEMSQWDIIRSHPSIIAGGVLLVIMILIALFGPLFTGDPTFINPIKRLKLPQSEF